MVIYIPVPVAELFDKISILEIKLAEITDNERLQHVRKELEILLKVVEEHGLIDFMSNQLYTELKLVNKVLWQVCNLRRSFESAGQFDAEFIVQSRNEYKTNDHRAAIKAKINKYFDSDIVEVKSYSRLSHEETTT
jgi:hypothetical protein